MKRGRRILFIAAGAVAAVAMAVLLWSNESEPAYQGKALSEWLKIYNNPENPTIWDMFPRRTQPAIAGRYDPVQNADYYQREQAELKRRKAEAAEAVRHIGTNALPLLLRWLDQDYPVPWKRNLAGVREKLPKMLQGGRVVEWWLIGRDNARIGLAYAGFDALGSNASPAVPELTRRMNTRSSDSGIFAIGALHSIGTNGLAPMLTALTNSQTPNRHWIASNLGLPLSRLGTNAGPVIAILAKCVADKDPWVAFHSADILGRLALEPDISVPALTKALSYPRPDVRQVAAMGLDNFGEQSWPAIPALITSLSDSDPGVRHFATNTLQDIAPEALRNF